jgi:hypothetical protein
MIKSLLLFSVLLISLPGFAQENIKKTMSATRVTVPPKIDGILDDEAWKNSEIISDLIQHQPNPGKLSERNSEVKLVYDNEAIYIAAYFYETSPDSIMKELSKRDELGNVDYCAFIFDTYNDGINGYGFFLTAAGVQLDAKYSTERGEDFSWDAVWESKVNIVSDGWIVEVKIPYSAIRFPKQTEQVWGFNAERVIRRTREMSFWNFVDPKINGFINQSGLLTGINNIESPLRLSFTPYISTTAEHFPYNIPDVENTSYKINGGMDLKYGINESFTLDMTLIPDFSQVQSDNQVLNLSPFEVQFVENRPFFTEGTELFSKGGLFYSRRVGGRPVNYFKVYNLINEGETVIENPVETQLLNATKISGRNRSGLGIGFFNATSAASFAKIRNEQGSTRDLMTQPLTNYNIFVLDKSLKNNSFVSLINTSVLREGSTYDANVTGAQFKFADKENVYAIRGDGAVSQIFNSAQPDPVSGHKYFLHLSKISGNFQYGVWHNLESDKYNPNDLGLLFSNNEKTFATFFRYNIYEPKGKFLNTWSYLEINYSRLYAPDRFQNFYTSLEAGGTFRNYLTVGASTTLEPVITFDFFEPRVPGRYYSYPKNYNFGGFVSSDYRKKLALDISGNYRIFEDRDRVRLNFNISPRWRVSDKLNFIYSFNYSVWPDDVGFVNRNNNNGEIYFGYRDVYTYSNTLSGSYKFNPLMALTLRTRHYWSKAIYNDYVLLDDEGLMQETDYFANHNVSFNAFNIDMVYSWRFAPGSELNLIWKNAILQDDNEIKTDFFHNFKHTLKSPHANNLSLKVLYYLDYQIFRKKKP